KDLVERGAVGDALAELDGLLAQRVVGERRDGRLECVDLAHLLRVLLQEPLVAAAENAGEDVDHRERRETATSLAPDAQKARGEDRLTPRHRLPTGGTVV